MLTAAQQGQIVNRWESNLWFVDCWWDQLLIEEYRRVDKTKLLFFLSLITMHLLFKKANQHLKLFHAISWCLYFILSLKFSHNVFLQKEIITFRVENKLFVELIDLFFVAFLFCFTEICCSDGNTLADSFQYWQMVRDKPTRTQIITLPGPAGAQLWVILFVGKFHPVITNASHAKGYLHPLPSKPPTQLDS